MSDRLRIRRSVIREAAAMLYERATHAEHPDPRQQKVIRAEAFKLAEQLTRKADKLTESLRRAERKAAMR